MHFEIIEIHPVTLDGEKRSEFWLCAEMDNGRRFLISRDLEEMMPSFRNTIWHEHKKELDKLCK